MFFYLSKILSYLLSPLFWILLLMIFSLIIKQKRKKRRLLLISIILLYFFSNHFIVHEVLRVWEIDMVNESRIKDFHGTGILLGGDIANYDKQKDRVIFRQNADRLIQALNLYNNGKISKILITAGPGHYLRPGEKEAEYCASFLRQSGVAAENIIIDVNSHNTNENAINSAELIKEKGLLPPYILITSAYHMRRAEKCFNKRGIDVIAYPVGNIAGARRYDPEHLFVANAQSFIYWQLLIHEMAGSVVYRIMGYTR